MQPLRSYSVVAKLPAPLKPLWDLAYNLWFAWNDDIADLFASMDVRLWSEVGHNPVALLNRLSQKTLRDLSEDEFFVERMKDLRRTLEHYMARKASSIPFPHHEGEQPVVAYFSFEYGLGQCLPIYSGGLGILAGDHLKSASDLNIPLVGVGLAYQQGYFRQYLTPDGWQQERYPIYDFEQMPIRLARKPDGGKYVIDVDLAGQKCLAQIWEVSVGRVRLFLLDANIPENPQHLRSISARLYGGNLEMRVWQEIMLGIGGVKALTAMGLHPKVIHMNEGHAAFAGLERIRVFMEDHGMTFEAAQELVASSNVFTTHTPVPAGNDRFPPELMQQYFEGYAQKLGLAFKVFMALGREDWRNDAEHFCMPVLALRLSRFNNGVSKLHGHVSRNMWKKVWPQFPVEDVPIGAITNGVHPPTWVAKDMALLYERYLGASWREDADRVRVWSHADSIPDSELWRAHERLRERLVDFVRSRLRAQRAMQGARRQEMEVIEDILDPQALTIGFARRFATYKRANLLLQDKDRLLRLLANREKRIQFIFAGKAHPMDNEGKRIIQQIVNLARMNEVRHSMVFLEDYDMDVAAYMYQGCDVWLNNPRRPLEACGTSGMKAMCNGVLNFSALDGWWDEAWTPDNAVGWAIGQGEEYEDQAYQDFVESQTLYNVLETEIIPEFYDRGHGNLPRSWIRKMKQSIGTLGPIFTSHRMVEDYVTKAYRPAYENYNRLIDKDFAPAKDLAAWRMDMMTKWSGIRVRNVRAHEPERAYVEEAIPVECEVFLNGAKPEHVLVELYAGPLNQDGSFAQRRTARMKSAVTTEDGWQKFKGEIKPEEAGRFGFTVRLLPHHPLLLDPHSLGLIRWAEEGQQ